MAAAIRSGKSRTGPYEMIIVRGAGRNQPPIGISVLDPPSGIGINGAFRVDEIRSVMVRNSQDKSGKWYKGGSITIRANVTPILDFSQPNPADESGMVATSFSSIEDYFK